MNYDATTALHAFEWADDVFMGVEEDLRDDVWVDAQFADAEDFLADENRREDLFWAMARSYAIDRAMNHEEVPLERPCAELVLRITAGGVADLDAGLLRARDLEEEASVFADLDEAISVARGVVEPVFAGAKAASRPPRWALPIVLLVGAAALVMFVVTSQTDPNEEDLPREVKVEALEATAPTSDPGCEDSTRGNVRREILTYLKSVGFVLSTCKNLESGAVKCRAAYGGDSLSVEIAHALDDKIDIAFSVAVGGVSDGHLDKAVKKAETSCTPP